MTNEKSDVALKQLTNCGLDNVPYHRREIVTEQIIQALGEDESALRRRVSILDERGEDALKSEALIYLLREFRQTEIFHLIYETLSRRILRIVYRYRTQVRDFDDFLQNVNSALLEKVLDFDANKGDFAQVSFGQYVLGLAKNEYRKYGAKEKINAVTDSADEDFENAPKIEIESKETSIETKLLTREALNRLPEHIREACVLYYLNGWKIESGDRNEPTLVKHFGKSERTVRNWLAEAKEILADWKGVLQ